MIKNYMKVAYRNLLKNPFFTTINVIAISIGMSVSLVLLAVIADVLEYDHFHSRYDRIYRVVTKVSDPYAPGYYATSPPALEEILREQADVETVVPIFTGLSGEVAYKQKKIPVSGYFTTPDFFRVFDFRFEGSDLSSALEEPGNLLLTRSEADKIFSGEEAVGKIVHIAPHGEFLVAGILEDPPNKSHIQFGMLASSQRIAPSLRGRQLSDDWNDYSSQFNYFLISESGSPGSIKEKLKKFTEDQNRKVSSTTDELILQPMSEMTMGRELRRSPGPQWDTLSMSIFAALAFLILAPACFNYANLSIAKALSRAREIGVRKVTGGQRKHIFIQFIVETLVMFSIAFVLSLGFFFYLKGEFLAILAPASRAGLTLTFSPGMALLFLLFILTSGFAIGLIPALYFSKLPVLDAINRRISGGRRRAFSPRNILLTFQFTFSLGFIIAVGIIINQYDYSVNYSPGYSTENVLNVTLSDVAPDRFSNAFDKLSYVESVSFSSGIMGTPSLESGWLPIKDESDSVLVRSMSVDHSYLEIHRIALIAGGGFSENPVFAASEVVVNKTLTEAYGYGNPNEMINQKIIMDGRELRVVGITDDFHYLDLREQIQPFLFHYSPSSFQYANIMVNNASSIHVESGLKDVWGNLSEEAYEASLLEDQVKEVYDWYYIMIKMTGFLGLLAISISCLGLLGMVVFNVSSRTKEVGIRKVHGASAGKIILILSKEYIYIFLLACAISIPVTTFLFSKMMPAIQYYSPAIGIAPVILGVIILLLLAGATVASQTVKAARINPAETLKYE